MKKNDIIILVSTLIYSYLFFNQTPGINILIFSMIITLMMILKDTKFLYNRLWLLSIGGALVSGTMVLLHGTFLPVLANLVSLSLAASFAMRKESSLILALLYSIYSYFFSLVNIFMRIYQRSEERAENKAPSYSIVFVTVIPVIITMIFFFIYREANPLFEEFTANIRFDFLSWNLIGFTLLGFILLYGYFNQQDILSLVFKDLSSPDKLRNDEASFAKPLLSINNENISGIVMFAMLNFLLLSVNIIDIYSLSTMTTFPEGFHYSQVVHQGINSLIISIVIAIAIILFYFRGSINFYESNQAIKILAFLWILQNTILVITCGIKNFHYVDEYGLTYKRIGVYVYLIMTLAGLVTTFIKIASAKSNWFLFRKNAWIGYAVLILSCMWNWDMLIVRYNLSGIATRTDLLYNASLSDAGLPSLIQYCKENESHMQYNKTFMLNLDMRKNAFISAFNKKDWQSWNYDDQYVYDQLTKSQN